jgi:UPF0716 protein FxsA
MPFLLIFITLPLLEIYAFIAAIDEIGFLNSFLLCVLTAAVGVTLVQRQGFNTLTRAQRELDDGYFPAHELFDGACLFLAGALFILPGFITDGIAILLLIPAVRRLIQAYALKHMDVHVQRAEYSYRAQPTGDILEGTFERVDTPDEDENREGPEQIDHRS